MSTSKGIKIVLIGNYPADKIESMDRFAQMLKIEFERTGIKTEIWCPQVLLAKFSSSSLHGLGKWLGYIDKWIINPFILRRFIRKKIAGNSNTYFHVCDHSNAFYLKFLPNGLSGITCHDVLAIRGALGYKDAYNPASRLGKIFQKWIFHYLSRAKFLASVSGFTLRQLNELKKQDSNPKSWRVIHNSLNADFDKMEREKAEILLKKKNVKFDQPFLLHVGSGLIRKNRKLLVDMIKILDSKWNGNICFAGEDIDEELRAYAKSFNLEGRIISFVKPDHNSLKALYNACDAFIFPSLSEGFGWPVIEAQACGTPVISSNIKPLMEISGGAALHADPTKPEQFVHAFLSLQNLALRYEIIENGFKNVQRFAPTKMVDSYLDLYGIKEIN